MRLNIGSGNTTIEGFKNLDIKQGDRADWLVLHDNGTVDEIRASHVLEHYPHGRVADVLAEWFRALKPGGLVRIAVPDFDLIATSYLRGQDINAQGYLMGGQTDEDDFHYALFNFRSLYAAMREAGFVNIQRWHSEIQDCASLPISLNLQGTKPDPKALTVCAVSSVPRFGPTLHARCCQEALMPLGIPLKQINGAFWGQCLTRGIEEVLGDSQPDLILTLDYDTVFRPYHVEALIDLMRRHPEADAIVPVQCHRGLQQIIMSVNDEKGQPVVEVTEDALKAELLPIASGHFGLSVFRTSAFSKLEKPWFIAHPDSEGTWGDARTDEDIHFWQQWRKAGLTVYLANRVPVGHMMELIAWPGRDLQPTFQSIGEFYASGTPQTIWI